MLYAVLGALMEKAAAALRSHAAAAGGEHADVQRRRVAAFLARVGRMWPGIVSALQQQNGVLRAALADAGGDADADADAGTGEDPVAEHVRLLTELDRLVEALHNRGDDERAVAARRRLRRSLAAAARIEMALVEGAPQA